MSDILVQIYHSDLGAYAPELSPVPRLKESFDVTLVTGETGGRKVQRYADDLGVKCFLGSDDNVNQRFADCMDELGIEYAARILNSHFMVEEVLLSDCMDELRGGNSDYVVFPRDFDMRFGADIFSRGFLDKARSVKGTDYRGIGFCPWAAVELSPDDFDLVCLDGIQGYSFAPTSIYRSFASDYYPERTPQSDLSTYRFAIRNLPSGVRRVADIACGDGRGTEYLKSFFNSVVGVDMEAPNWCKSGDALDAGLFPANHLDAVISIHTMEHLRDDRLFLKNCSHWLKSGGRLILEVPLLMRYPIGEVINPHHIREYEIESLKRLCGEYFQVEMVFGVARGFYLSEDRARNAVMLVLKND